MHIAIIGNGITGTSTARYIRKLSNQHRITLISSETKHFYSRTALMYIYMGHMTYKNTKPYEDFFWEKNRIDLVHDHVEQIDFDAKRLNMRTGKPINYDKLLIATGSKPNKFGWPGQDLKGVQGLYSFQDLENMEHYTDTTKQAVIVGGGLIGIEVAEMLLSRQIGITFLVREQSFWDNVLPAEESGIINQHIREHHIDLRLATELKEIIPDNSGRVRAVVTNKGETIDCQFVALTAGVSPNIDFVKNTDLATARGILVNHYLETNLPDVYAAGDCAQFSDPLAGRRPIEQVWYTGRMQGITAAYNICGQHTPYKPRLWFNSAKFLDIEYQTYGTVTPQLKENEAQFYWLHPSQHICLKMVFNKQNYQLRGINVLGMRLRHDVLEQWLHEQQSVDYVLSNFKAINFDPEFYKKHETNIIAAFNQQYPSRSVALKAKKGLLKLIFR